MSAALGVTSQPSHADSAVRFDSDVRFDSAVRFEERQRVLSLFAEAIAGRFVHLSPSVPGAPPLPYGSPNAGPANPATGGELPGDVPVVVVPAVIDDFPDARLNAGAYRLAVLRQIEDFQSGLSTFDLADAAEHHQLSLVAGSAAQLPKPFRPTWNVDFDRFVAKSPDAELICRLLPLLEVCRIDAVVSRRYPGARADLRRARHHKFQSMPPGIERDSPAGFVVDVLRRFALGADMSDYSGPGSPLVRMISLVDSLRHSSATLYDSTAVAVEIASLIDAASAWLLSRPDPDTDTMPTPDPDPATETVDAPGGTKDRYPVDEIEYSDDDLAGTRADFGRDLLDDGSEGQGHGTSADTLQQEEPQLNEQGKKPTPKLEVTGIDDGDPSGGPVNTRTRPQRPTHDQRTYFYPEWDYLNNAYLPSWCRLQERRLKGRDFTFIHDVRRRHPTLTLQVRRRFGSIRPEAWHRVHRTPDGDEMSLDSMVETVVDRRSGHATDEHLYIRRERAVRDVAAAFLLDMSRSTDSPVVDPHAELPPPPPVYPEGEEPYLRGGYFDFDEFQLDLSTPKRRVIDVAKEALAVMCDALQALGDSHAVYGFSGNGRHNVEFHVAKEFSDPTSIRTWAALGAMEPIRYTRMGPAIRHAAHKLTKQPERTKVLVIVTDGYPQDEGYGPDRNDRSYGIHDTAKALAEAQNAGISTFCITIDPAGHDYLRRMCPEHRYLVIDDVHNLAVELEKVYRVLTGRDTGARGSLDFSLPG